MKWVRALPAAPAQADQRSQRRADRGSHRAPRPMDVTLPAAAPPEDPPGSMWGSCGRVASLLRSSRVRSLLAVRPGAPALVASDRSVRSDARSPVRSFLLLVSMLLLVPPGAPSSFLLLVLLHCFPLGRFFFSVPLGVFPVISLQLLFVFLLSHGGREVFSWVGCWKSGRTPDSSRFFKEAFPA